MNDDGDNTTPTAQNDAEKGKDRVKNKERLHSPKKKTTSLHKSINMKAKAACKKNLKFVIERSADCGIQYTNGNTEWSSCASDEEYISSSLGNRINITKGIEEKKNVLNQNVLATYSEYKSIPKDLPSSSYLKFKSGTFIKYFHDAFPQVDDKLNTRASAKSFIDENHYKPNNAIKDSPQLSPNTIYQTQEAVQISPNNISKRVFASHANNKIDKSKNKLQCSDSYEQVNKHLSVSDDVKSPINKQESEVSHSSPIKALESTGNLKHPDNNVETLFLNTIGLAHISQKQVSNIPTIQTSPHKISKEDVINDGNSIVLAEIEVMPMSCKDKKREDVEKIDQRSSKEILQNSLEKLNAENAINDKVNDSVPTHASKAVEKQSKFQRLNKGSRIEQKKQHLIEVISPDTSTLDNSTLCISPLKTSTSIELKSVSTTNELNETISDLERLEVNCTKIPPKTNSSKSPLLSKIPPKQKRQTKKKRKEKKVKIDKDNSYIDKRLNLGTTIPKTSTEEENLPINIPLAEGSKEDSEMTLIIQDDIKEQELHCVKNVTSVPMLNYSSDDEVLDYEAMDAEEILTEAYKSPLTQEIKNQKSQEYPKFNGTYTNAKSTITSTVPTNISECTLDNLEESPAISNTTESKLTDVITSTSSSSVETESNYTLPELPATNKNREKGIDCQNNEMPSSSEHKEPDSSYKPTELSFSSKYQETSISYKSNEQPSSSKYIVPDISHQNRGSTSVMESKGGEDRYESNKLTSNTEFDMVQNYCNDNELEMSDKLPNQSRTYERFRYRNDIDDSSDSELSGMEDNYMPVFGYQPCGTFQKPYSKSSLPDSEKMDFIFKKPMLKKPKKKLKAPKEPQFSADELEIFASEVESELDDLVLERSPSPQSSLSFDEVERNSYSSDEETENVTRENDNTKSSENCSKGKNISQLPLHRVKSPVGSNRLLQISYKSYCPFYLKHGSCSLKCCKYRHTKPFCSPQALQEIPVQKCPDLLTDPRKIVSESSQIAVIEEACKSGLLEKAFDDAKNLFIRNPHSELKSSVISILLEASVNMGNESHLYDISHKIFKDFDMLDRMHCSNFIMACNSKPRKTFKSAVKMFELCFQYRIALEQEAVAALHDIFCLDRTQWNLTLRLMWYKSTVCRQGTDMQLLKDALTICVHGSETRSDAKFTLKTLSSILRDLSEVNFKELMPEKVRALISLFKQHKFPPNLIDSVERRANKFFGMPKIPDYADANQLHCNTALPIANPNRRVAAINTAMEKNDWTVVVNIFRQCVLRLDFSLLIHIQRKILSKENDILPRFLSFIKAATSKHIMQTPELMLQENFFLAKIGGTLLEETYHKKDMQTAFGILIILHRNDLKYFQTPTEANPERYQLLSDPNMQKAIVYSWNLVLIAIDVCLSNKCPLDALSIMSDLPKMSDDTVAPENWTDVACLRVRLLIKMNNMLLKQKKEMFYCEQALNFLMAFTTDEACNFLPEKTLEEVKHIFNRYLLECINSQNIEKAEELLETMTHRGLFSDIKPMILRGLLVKYYSIGEEKKSEALFRKCNLCGLYSFTIPNVHLQPREICLSTEWTYYELRVILNDIFKKFYKMLDPYNTNYSFEDWFSLTFKFEEQSTTSDPQFLIEGLSNISTHVKDFRVRVMKALDDMSFSWEEYDITSDHMQYSIKIQPKSLYQMFTQWKNNYNAKDLSDVSVNSSFEWPGRTSQNFGSSKSRSSSENELKNTSFEILDRKVPKPVQKTLRMEKGINSNEYASSGRSSSHSSDQETSPGEVLPLKKSKIRHRKAFTSGAFSLAEAKSMNLCISLNSGGREITSRESNVAKNVAAEKAALSPKHISPNKVQCSSPSKKIFDRSIPTQNDSEYDWIISNHSPGIRRKLLFTKEDTTTSGKIQNEQAFSTNVCTSKAFGAAATNFREIQTFNSFSTSTKDSFTQPVLSHQSQSNPHTIQRKPISWSAKTEHAVPSTSTHFADSISDFAQSGVEQLRYSLMVIINQKRKNVSSTEKEKMATELMEKFLAKYKVTENELSQKRTKMNLIKYAQAYL